MTTKRRRRELLVVEQDSLSSPGRQDRTEPERRRRGARAGCPARAALVDRAEQVRAALLRVSRTGAAARSGSSSEVAVWHRAQIEAQRYLQAYRAAVNELGRRDRLARRVGTEWLEVAVTAHWYRVGAADDVEELAREYLSQLPLGTCPPSAGRHITGAHRSAIAVWLAEHRSTQPDRGARDHERSR